MIPDYKFAFVSLCFIVALFSYAKCISVKEWGFLVCGLAFTVLADYFLILRDEHFLGVAAFCFVHIFYIFRAVDIRTVGKKKILFAVAVISIIIAVGSVILLAALYACLFGINIYVNIKTRRPKLNYFLVTAGLILFALCDVCVMLFNLPRYIETSFNFSFAFVLIWIFYLPSQAMLAVSAIRRK